MTPAQEPAAEESRRHHRSGASLPIVRILMIVSSMAPLFVLLAFRGTPLIPDSVLLASCTGLIVGPYVAIAWRVRRAKTSNDRYSLPVERYEDHRDHLLVYLFAILLPFYMANLTTWRDVLALAAAIFFVGFAFWHMNLHHLNVAFAARGYRVYTVYGPTTKTGEAHARVLITRRSSLATGRIAALRLSDTVYLE